MPLDLLPVRQDSAAANMAADFLLLQHYPKPDHARFRHYGWHRPAVTFGYAQRIGDVRGQLGAAAAEWELCRRPTGGGIVDHRDDWTYALVIPTSHDLGAAPAPAGYAVVHNVLAAALREQSIPAELQPAQPPKDAGGVAVCFQRAEPADVIRTDTGAKLAGAAQKRGKRGLLFQGSVSRTIAGDINWDRFGDDFTAGLQRLLGLPCEAVSWPEAWDEAVDALADDYASTAWLERR
jgi:lipoate-protein ligase A